MLGVFHTKGQTRTRIAAVYSSYGYRITAVWDSVSLDVPSDIYVLDIATCKLNSIIKLLEYGIAQSIHCLCILQGRLHRCKEVTL